MRIGFIGGNGHHYLRHLLGSESQREYSVAAASDGQDVEAVRGLSEKIGTPQWFNSPSQMLDEFQPEVVSIGAVYGFNGEIAALALERGISVVSDKPIAATWRQLERLRELTREYS